MGRQLKIINDADLFKLQECLLRMYCDIKAVCDKYNLTIVLGGGSALGAVRHNGFIPWDDDLDLNMPRKDYEKLLSVLENELGEEYYFSAPHSKDVESQFLKIHKKDTIFSDIFDKCENTGVWIDIFPIDYAPNSVLMQKVKGFLVDVLVYISISLFISQKSNELVFKHYKENGRFIRYCIAKMTNILLPISHKKIFNFIDSIAFCKNASNYVTVATGRARYAGECMPIADLFPVRELYFDGIKVNVYNNVEGYLSRLYGDYMKIPPVEKREHHSVSKFYISDDVGWLTERAKNYTLKRK